MTEFFDTSALLPAFFDDHVHHERSIRALSRVSKRNASCAAHSLAEIYATTTRLPGRHRVSGDQALLFVQSVSDRLSLIHLDAREYVETLARAASHGIVGGAIYDALILACARKARARVVYSWNVGDFRRVDPDLADRVQEPP